MTSALLPLPFFHPSMCSLAASHARTFPKPESELALKDLARAFGLSSPELLASFDPDTWSLRTSQGSLLAEEQWGECLETLPDSGMWDAGAVYELRSSEPATFESASSLWPTSQAHDGTGPRGQGNYLNDGHYKPHDLAMSAQTWPTARQEDGESCGNHPGVVDSLTGATKLWRTPDSPGSGGPRNRQDSIGDGHQVTIAEQAEHWKTPHGMSNTDFRGKVGGCGGGEFGLQANNWQMFPASLPAPQIQNGQLSSESAPTSRQRWATPTDSMATMQDQEQAQTAGNSPDRPKYGSLEKRRLNPRFVCWLMGFPLGWTERCKTAPSD
jgi:hypothetical protein